MYTHRRSAPRIITRTAKRPARGPTSTVQLEGLNFDFLKKAASAGAKIINAGAAAKTKAAQLATQVRTIADRVDSAGVGVQRVAQRGREAADSIESAGRAAEGAAQGAVAGAGYGGIGGANAVLLGVGLIGAIGLVAYTLGRGGR